LGGISPPFTYLPTPLQRGEMRARERGEEGSKGVSERRVGVGKRE